MCVCCVCLYVLLHLLATAAASFPLGRVRVKLRPRSLWQSPGEVAPAGALVAPGPGSGAGGVWELGLVLGLNSTGLVRPRLVKASRVPSGSTITLITARGEREHVMLVCVCVSVCVCVCVCDVHLSSEL